MLMAIPKTMYFNFRMFDFKTAIHFHVIIAHNTKLRLGIGGQSLWKIEINNIFTFCLTLRDLTILFPISIAFYKSGRKLK